VDPGSEKLSDRDACAGIVAPLNMTADIGEPDSRGTRSMEEGCHACENR